VHPIDLIRAAQSRPLSDEDSIPIDLVLQLGLGEDAIRRFEAALPCPLPEQARQLLRFCRGFEGPLVEPVDFTGRDLDFEQTDVFPHGMPIAGDGYGNLWVVDLTPESQVFGPVWFACHDALPVFAYQRKKSIFRRIVGG